MNLIGSIVSIVGKNDVRLEKRGICRFGGANAYEGMPFGKAWQSIIFRNEVEIGNGAIIC